MSYVNCARSQAEQNLVVVQESEELFYEASRDIPSGGELLVWYGPQYLQFMGIPVTLKTAIAESVPDRIDHESKYKIESMYFMEVPTNNFYVCRHHCM